jgi:hypothetical protein
MHACIQTSCFLMHALQVLNVYSVAWSVICSLHAVQTLGPRSPSLSLLAQHLDKNSELQHQCDQAMSCVNPQPDLQLAVPTPTAGFVEGIGPG